MFLRVDVYKSFESGEIIKIKKRRVIDTTNKVFAIEDGFVGVYVGQGKGRRLLVLMKEGNIFPLALSSETPLWQSEVYYYTLGNTTLYALPIDEYLRSKANLSREDLKKELETKTRGNNTLMERVVNLLTYDVSRRLYMRLILLADFVGCKKDDKAVLDTPMTYVDIAESIGTTRETVNRLITVLQNDGVVSVKKRIITINSLSKLEELYKSKRNP